MSEVMVFWSLVALALGLSVCRVMGCRARGCVWTLALLCAMAAGIIWVLHALGLWA